MAARIDYEVKPTPIGPDAQEELGRLLESLHEHGFLRLAHDMVCANADIAQVLVGAINRPGTLNAIQNLSILLMALSRIPPAQFYKAVFAMAEAFGVVSDGAAGAEHKAAPGLSGAYRMLRDEELWHALAPLIEGLKAFAAGLGKQVDKPISDFTGKESSA